MSEFKTAMPPPYCAASFPAVALFCLKVDAAKVATILVSVGKSATAPPKDDPRKPTRPAEFVSNSVSFTVSDPPCSIAIAPPAISTSEVGSGVGSKVGSSVGSAEGVSVGENDGARLGAGVGSPVGDNVGISVGISVGLSDGISVGKKVGISVGPSVGTAVGTRVGLKLRHTTQPSVPLAASQAELSTSLNHFRVDAGATGKSTIWSPGKFELFGNT